MQVRAVGTAQAVLTLLVGAVDLGDDGFARLGVACSKECVAVTTPPRWSFCRRLDTVLI